MIDIDQMQGVLEFKMESDKRYGVNHCGGDFCENASEITYGEAMELITRLRQAEKDAARYRWLRDTGCFEGSADDLFHATPAETDAEFDRFMQCNK